MTLARSANRTQASRSLLELRVPVHALRRSAVGSRNRHAASFFGRDRPDSLPPPDARFVQQSTYAVCYLSSSCVSSTQNTLAGALRSAPPRDELSAARLVRLPPQALRHSYL